MLQRYKYTIEYKRGAANHVADVLSRAPLHGQEMQVDPDLMTLVNAAPIPPDSRWGTLVTREEVLAAQLSDGLFQNVMHQLAEENAADAENPKDLDSYLLSSDGILLRYVPQADDGSSGLPFRPVIPCKLRKSFMRYMHDSALAGHSSGSKINLRKVSPNCDVAR